MTSPSRRVRFDLAYDGTEFAGWQLQPGQRTVQGVLEEALSRLQGGVPVRVRAAGRTDAGVHARGQVADAELAVRLDDQELVHALRKMLPADLRPLRAMTVDRQFHSRRDVLSKTYCYRLDRTPGGDPFQARYALHHPAPLDRAALAESLSTLPGRRDWSGFAGSACNVEERVRNLAAAVYEEPTPDEGIFTFTGDGFLNYMVRNIVGTLLEVAVGRFSSQHVNEILVSGDRTLAGPTAPPHGLCLERVRYPGEA